MDGRAGGSIVSGAESQGNPVPARAAQAGAPIAPRPAVGTRLLIVEDNAATNFAVRAFFQSVGYDVDAVADVAGAARLLDDERYDVVITDLNLGPGDANGVEVISHARRVHPNACIIMLTAFGSAAAEHEARRRGADLFCTKPVGLHELGVFIDRVLRRDHSMAGLPGQRR
jgi:two-component system OmpR family response regulator/two-component system response regulator QseB/OmpR-family two-component system manganese-sensing response regulator